MHRKDALGIRGEAAAERHLTSLGMRIIARRARVPAGEIDLVVLDGREVVFVEVKTRGGHGFGAPEEAVTYAKRRTLRRASVEWLDRHDASDAPYRIDVIAVVADPSADGMHVEHFVSAVGETG